MHPVLEENFRISGQVGKDNVCNHNLPNFLQLFQKIYLPDTFCCFYFIFFGEHAGPIKHPVPASAHPKSLVFQ